MLLVTRITSALAVPAMAPPTTRIPAACFRSLLTNHFLFEGGWPAGPRGADLPCSTTPRSRKLGVPCGRGVKTFQGQRKPPGRRSAAASRAADKLRFLVRDERRRRIPRDRK